MSVRTYPLVGAIALSAGALCISGCYRSAALIEARRVAAIQEKLEEVDLGVYRVTLPPAGGSSTHGVVEFHAFGQVTNQERARVEESLEERDAEFRHHMLLAVRGLTLEEIREPSLDVLRSAVQAVVNRPWDEPLVKNVGFYKFNFMPL